LGVIEGDIAMATLRILIADDQIPPAELTEQEFRDQFFLQRRMP
jgi:hypothetical protein